MLTQPKPKTYSNSSWSLDIASQTSPLSRWWGQALVKILGFRLQFHSGEKSADLDDRTSGRPIVVQGNQLELESLTKLTEQYIQSVLSPVALPGESASRPGGAEDDAPEWQSDSGYRHRLYLGSLQVEPIISELEVSTTQLYDLAEILHASLATVQSPAGVARDLPTRSLSWSKTAAAAAVAVGLTGGIAWFVTGGPSFQTASDSTANSDDELISSAPQPGVNSGKNGLNLPPNFEAKPTTPPTNKPGSPKSPASSKTDSSKSLTSSPTPTTSISKTDDSKTNNSKATSQLNDSAQPTTSQDSTSTTPSKTASKPPSESPSKAKPQKPSETSNPKSSAKKTPDATATTSKAKSTQSKPEQETQPSDLPSAGSPSPAAQAPELDQLAAAPKRQAARVAPPAAPQAEFSTSDVARPQSNSGPAPEVVLTFFQSQWKGQDVLDQSLSYRIEVQPDGTVSTVVPKTDLASTQIEQTPVPPAGSPLTPPFPGPNSVMFDVTLYPDGTVSVK